MRRASRIVILCILAVSGFGAGPPPKAARPARIRVDRAHHGFLAEGERRFVPFGVSYYRPGTGCAPQLWKQFDAEATRRDFLRLKEKGGNVVRVFLSFGSFLSEPDRLDPDGLAKFDRLLDLAGQQEVRLEVLGRHPVLRIRFQQLFQ